MFILIHFCSNRSLNVWHIVPVAFTIVYTLNDLSVQHLYDTLQLLKLGLVAGILRNTENYVQIYFGWRHPNVDPTWTLDRETKIFILPVLT
jgi:hypothetical protein